MDDQSNQSFPFSVSGLMSAGPTVAVAEPPDDPPPAADEKTAPAASEEPVAEPVAAAEAAETPELQKETIEPTVAEGEASPAGGNKLVIVVKALKTIEQNIANLIRLLEEDQNLPSDMAAAVTAATSELRLLAVEDELAKKINDGRVTEGVFDGQHMVGSDGKIYTVPANYASKSKLVEGDLLKLTITPKGSFIYKQIGPIERSRVIASLGFDPTNGEYYAMSDNRRWNIIKASVTYFKGERGDEIVLLVPKNAPSKWAAVENVIKKDPLAM